MFNIAENEKNILDFWNKEQIFKKSLEKEAPRGEFSFYDGPPFATGLPHYGHIVASSIKDMIPRYMTMRGYRVERRWGWDCHGLPVENLIEKELGFKTKKDIEDFGVDKFNETCRASVFRFTDEWKAFIPKVGRWVDMENDYRTMNPEFMQSTWWVFKTLWDKGLIYEGHKAMHVCPRCETTLANFEVTQGYKDISDLSATVKFELVDEPNTFMLAWTTTPWTLPGNVALAVGKDIEYSKVSFEGANYFVATSRLEAVFKDKEYQVVSKCNGIDLLHRSYKPVFDYFVNDESIKNRENGWKIYAGDFVTTEDGTGIVHIAPAFGADDAEVGKKYNLPYLNPVGEDGCYTEGPWKGMYIFDADKEVIKWLKENDKLFKKQKMVHNYPHCWRCHTPLLYYSKPSYYLEITKIKDKIVEANKTVNWFPSYVGEKRFGNWLEELKDWALSRQRYWGTPLPLWICDCGHQEMIGSREELAEKAIEKVDPKTIDLHRPFVDDIHLTCPKCGGKMTRTTDVIDCWFDSGAMPFSQYHYPFENKELWENQFPADFICEGIDQTRGWFYSLMVISVFVTGKSPYKNVLVNDLLLDKDGKKMSKSKGNIVEPFTTMKTYGADGVRWYLPYVSPVWTPLKFDVEGIKDINSKFFNTLKNTYTFFEMYANTDEVDPRTFDVDYKDLEDIDKWLLSKYNNLVKDVTEVMDVYDVNKAVHLIQYFVCEELSNWYIRRNRRRFWGSKLDKSKKAVYKTTYDVLVGLCKLIAPISPFISDEIYMNLTGEESVHLADFPVCNKKLINAKLEEKMDLIIELISTARNIREEAKIKVRQPISEVIFEDKYKSTIKEFESLICEELNAKSVIWAKDMSEYLTIGYKPNFKEVGKMLGSNISKFQEYLKNISEEDAKLLEAGELKLDLGGVEYTIDNTFVLKDIKAKEGYAAVMLNYNKVAINTVLT